MTDQTSKDVKAQVKASYDAIADTYNTVFTKPNETLRLDYLSRLVTKLQSSNKDTTATVLELGCGAGVPATKFLLESSNPLFRITANDISTSQLALARSNLAQYADRLTLLEGDMLSLDFEKETFDAVTGFYSIIHLPRNEQILLMEKIAGWLKPGGYLLANFSVADMAELVENKWMGHDKGWMFWSGWGEEKSVEMVEKVGLRVEVREVKQAEGDAVFVWVLAKKER